MEMKIAVRMFLALEKVSFYIFHSLAVYISTQKESFSWRGYPTENESDFLPLSQGCICPFSCKNNSGKLTKIKLLQPAVHPYHMQRGLATIKLIIYNLSQCVHQHTPQNLPSNI